MDFNEPGPSTSTSRPRLPLPGGFDAGTVSEIFLSVHNFLERNNCVDTARLLREEVDRLQLLAPRPHLLEDRTEPETFAHFQRTHNNTMDLLPILSRLNDLSQKNFPILPQVTTVRLSAHAPYSLLRNSTKPPTSPPKAVVPTALPYQLNGLKTRDRIQTIKFGGHVPSQMVLSKKVLTNFKRHTRTMGHKSPLYCITFDRTGKYIITGADDNLIKVWDAQTCLLRYTYRGHTSEICDLSVSHENTLLASGSNDKTVRIWCMQTGSVRNIFKFHTGQLSTVCFPAFFQGGVRYLISASTDCSIIFYRWSSETRQFLDHERFLHKEGGPGKFLCASYSAGGNFAAFAGSQKTIYIYMLDVQSVRCIATLKDIHTDSIDTMAWSHRGLKFVTGAHDGRLFVWDFKFNSWKGQELKLPSVPIPTVSKLSAKKSGYKVNAVAWTLDDDFVFTTGSDNYIRVWNSKTCILVTTLKGHDKIVYYMRAHPTNADLIVSAGYDGMCLIWDVPTLSCVQKIANSDDASKNQSIFDAALSPDGTMIAFADDSGHVTINGIYPNERAKIVPKQQFFDNDYIPLVTNPNGFPLDHLSGLLPHLCDPPLLERSDGIPYAEEWQLLVPGRAAMMRDGTTDNLPGDFCAWKTQMIFQPYPDMAEITRTANFDGFHHHKQYLMESRKTPPKGWNADPVTPKKPNVPFAMPVVEPVISPDIINLDSDSDDDDYSADTSRSVTPDSISEREPDNPNAIAVEDEDDSDYFEGHVGHETVFRTSTRRRRRQEQQPVPTSNPTSGNESASRRRRREIASPEESNTVRSNSVRVNSRHTRANPLQEAEPRVRTQRKKGRPRRVIESSDDNISPDRSIPIENQPQPASQAPSRGRRIRQYPEWMKKVSLQRFPYIPQCGDRVVYFPFGHKTYLDDCKKHNVYNPLSRDYPRSDLNSQEFATVEKLQYRFAPYHCVALWLNLQSGYTIKVYYHELVNTPDYIIPLELYEKSVQYDFKTGDRIESIMDNKWWTGIVESRELNQVGYSECQYNSIVIKWDNGDEDHISPWDIQPYTVGRRSEAVATTEEINLYSSLPVRMEDWKLPSGAPDCGRNADLARTHHLNKVNNALQQLNTVPALTPFQHPVNLADHPEYLTHIPYPIDLQTINERLSNKYYRTLTHLKLDIQLIANNAIKFNEPNSEIAVNSKRLVETLFYVIDNASPENALDYFTTLFDQQPSELGAYKIDLFSAARSTNGTRKHSRRMESSHGEPGVELWVTECRTACEEIITDSVKNLIEDELNPVLESFNNGEYESPNQLLQALNEVFQSSLSNQNRRTLAHRQLNTILQNLEHKFKPITEKFNRMANDTRTNRQKRSATLKSSTMNEHRSLRTRRNMNYNEDAPQPRRSARQHMDLNYAELNQGINGLGEDISNNYQNSLPGPSIRKSPSRVRSSVDRSHSQTNSNVVNLKTEIENEDELPAHSETFDDAVLSRAVASTPSVQESLDSDYVGDEDMEEEEHENDLENEAVPEDPLSSESEGTAISTEHSNSPVPLTRRRPKSKRSRESNDTTSTRSSEESVRRSTRKRKPKTRDTSPLNPPKRKKAKMQQPRRSSRARSNHQKYCEESDDEEPINLPTKTKSGRIVQKKHH